RKPPQFLHRRRCHPRHRSRRLRQSRPRQPCRRGPHDWRHEMTTATVNEPVSGYDSLKTKEVIASLSKRSQVELAEIESYEHTHQERVSVFDKLRWLRQDEPLLGYDSLSSEEVVTALEET